MTRKWKRRVAVTAAMLVGGVIGIVLVLWILMRGTPEWYRPRSMTPEQLEAAAQRATNKLAMVQNEAARARAIERAGRRHASTLPVPDAITVSFTDDELNAFFDKWSVFQTVKNSYEKFLADPYIVLQDGRLILAGRLKEVNAIVSLHFEPRMDEQGRLDLKLARVLAGKLPLPDAVFDKYQARAVDALQRRLPAWRRDASIDSTGVANSSAISAAMAGVLIDIFDHQPADPVLFLPLVDHGSVPVKLLDVKIEDHTLTLTVMPMTAEERAHLLSRIKRGGQQQE